MKENKIIIINIGCSTDIELTQLFEEGYDVINFIEEVYAGNIPGGKKSDSFFTFSYEDENAFIDNILQNRNTAGVIIRSVAEIHSKNKYKSKITGLLYNMFLIFKYLYSPLMMLKGCKVWVLEPDIINHDGNNMVMSAYIKAFQKGIINLARIAAIELARKKISINVLAGKLMGPDYKNVRTIINWAAKRKNIYLTAQTLKE